MDTPNHSEGSVVSIDTPERVGWKRCNTGTGRRNWTARRGLGALHFEVPNTQRMKSVSADFPAVRQGSCTGLHRLPHPCLPCFWRPSRQRPDHVLTGRRYRKIGDRGGGSRARRGLSRRTRSVFSNDTWTCATRCDAQHPPGSGVLSISMAVKDDIELTHPGTGMAA